MITNIENLAVNNFRLRSYTDKIKFLCDSDMHSH
jgi:hypothetical protein